MAKPGIGSGSMSNAGAVRKEFGEGLPRGAHQILTSPVPDPRTLLSSGTKAFLWRLGLLCGHGIRQDQSLGLSAPVLPCGFSTESRMCCTDVLEEGVRNDSGPCFFSKGA